jgi:hypothetical protein
MITIVLLTISCAAALYAAIISFEHLFNRTPSAPRVVDGSQTVSLRVDAHLMQPVAVWGLKRTKEIAEESPASAKRAEELRKGLAEEDETRKHRVI